MGEGVGVPANAGNLPGHAQAGFAARDGKAPARHFLGDLDGRVSRGRNKQAGRQGRVFAVVRRRMDAVRRLQVQRLPREGARSEVGLYDVGAVSHRDARQGDGGADLCAAGGGRVGGELQVIRARHGTAAHDQLADISDKRRLCLRGLRQAESDDQRSQCEPPEH